MTTFYLLRHGQSEGNLNALFIGQGNSPLTELGINQARLTGNYLKDVHFDVAYASDLIRAYDTGKMVLEDREIELNKNKNLREIFAGDWEGRQFSELEIDFADEYLVWKQDIGLACPQNGEKVAQLYERVNNEIVRLSKIHDGQTVLIATHATPIRCITAKAKGISVENLRQVPWVPNSSITVLQVDNEKFTLIKEGIAEHLGQLTTRLPKNV